MLDLVFLACSALVLPCLLLALAAGPSGLLLYLALWAGLRGVTTLEPEGPAPSASAS